MATRIPQFPKIDRYVRSSKKKPTESQSSIERGAGLNSAPVLLFSRNFSRLQRTIGNRATIHLITRAQPTNVSAYPFIQRVGGPKLGFKKNEKKEYSDEILKKLGEILYSYKKDIKEQKETALRKFTEKGNIKSQTIYSKALSEAEMTYEGLKERITPESGFVVNANKIKYNGKEIAEILQGNSAYEELQNQSEINHTYKKHAYVYGETPPSTNSDYVERFRLSEKEYVKINEHMLRRFAYRGITPAEITNIKEGSDVHPMIGNKSQGSSGWHFYGDFTGKRRDGSNTDLKFLQKLVEEYTIDKSMYAFLQARKGVNKFFSFRSTPKQISSNHGGDFSSKYGEIKIDLAKVPKENFIFHYAGSSISMLDFSGRFKIRTGREDMYKKELDRAYESIIRNREIILSKYPASAVVEWKNEPNIPTPIYMHEIGKKHGRHGIKCDWVLCHKEDYEKGWKEGEQEKNSQNTGRAGKKRTQPQSSNNQSKRRRTDSSAKASLTRPK